MSSCKKTCNKCDKTDQSKKACKKAHLTEAIKKELKNKKRCSFCKTDGHDKEDCDERTSFVNLMASDCLTARRTILKRMEEFGLGIGSLVSFRTLEHDEERDVYIEQNTVGIVVNIFWEEISQLTRSGRRLDHIGIMHVKRSTNSGQDILQRLKLPEIITKFESISVDIVGHGVKILSSVEVDARNVAPKNFLDFDECVKTVMRFTSYGYF